MGFNVLALDIDENALRAIRWREDTVSGTALSGRICPVRVDLSIGIPVPADSVSVAIAVHLPTHTMLEGVWSAMVPGGFLIVETFGGQGENWRDLPEAGAIAGVLGFQFDLLVCEERRVGPVGGNAVAAKIFAQRKR
jgi:hypothetical protein